MNKLFRFSLLALVALVSCMGLAQLVVEPLVNEEAGRVSADYAQGRVSLAYADFVSVEYGEGDIEVFGKGGKVATLRKDRPGEEWNTLNYMLSEKLADGTYTVKIPSGAVKGCSHAGARVSSISSAEISLLVDNSIVKIAELAPDTLDTAALFAEWEGRDSISNSAGGNPIMGDKADGEDVFEYAYYEDVLNDDSRLEELLQSVQNPDVPAGMGKGWTFSNVTPAQDQVVDGFRKIEFAYAGGVTNIARLELQCPDGSTNGIYIYDSMGSISGALDEMTTLPGKYTLKIPAGALTNWYNQPCAAMSYTWTVSGNGAKSKLLADEFEFDDDEFAALREAEDMAETEFSDDWLYSDDDNFDYYDEDIFAYADNSGSVIAADSLPMTFEMDELRQESVFALGDLGQDMLEDFALNAGGVSMSTESYYDEKMDFDFPVRYNQCDDGKINWISGTKLIFKAKEKIIGLRVGGDFVESVTADKGIYERGLWTGCIEEGDSLVLTANGSVGVEALTVYYDMQDEEYLTALEAMDSVPENSELAIIEASSDSLGHVTDVMSIVRSMDLHLNIAKRDWSTIGSESGEVIGVITTDDQMLDRYTVTISSDSQYEKVLPSDQIKVVDGKIICTSPTSGGFDLYDGHEYTMTVYGYASSVNLNEPIAKKSFQFMGSGKSFFDVNYSVANVNGK